MVGIGNTPSGFVRHEKSPSVLSSGFLYSVVGRARFELTTKGLKVQILGL